MLSTTAAESRDGMNRSYENAVAELEHRHGVEGAQGIIADAKAAAAQLPKRAFEFLEDWNLANDPTVVSRFGLAWRNRRTAAR